MERSYTSYKYRQFQMILDSLMGPDRNGDGNGKRVTGYDDDRVCKYCLAGCCPFKLLENTRMSKGPCKYQICPPSEEIVASYRESRKGSLTAYDYQLFNVLDGIITAADERIAYSKSLRSAQSAKAASNPVISEYNQRIQTLLQQSRERALAGYVGEGKTLLDRAGIVKEQRAGKETELVKASDKEQKSLICPICSAVVTDADVQQRMEDHLAGRQHRAFLRMREVYEQLKSEGATPRQRNHKDHRQKVRELPRVLIVAEV